MPKANIRSRESQEHQPIQTYQRTLYIDVDDTCLDVLGGYVRWLASLSRIKKSLRGQPLLDREHLGDWLGVDQDLSELWFKEFTNHTWQWGALPSILNAGDALASLKKQGWHMVALAHGANEMARAQLRRANLEMLFPNVFRDQFLIPLGGSFYPYMRDHDDAVCVTASIRTARDAVQAGHSCYLIERSWSKHFNDISVVKKPNWESLIITLFQTQPAMVIS